MEYSLVAFIAKKIISLMIMPLSLWFIISMLGLWYLYKNNITKSKKMLSFSFIWIILISYAPFANLLIKPLEQYYPKLDIKNIPNDVKYVFILGGDIDARTWEVMRLYNKVPHLKIITSGRSIVKKISEAKETQIRLVECGITKDDILMNEKAKDTQEEVEDLKKLIGDTPFILVTSAYHLPRAMLMFKSNGLKPIPSPTDFQIASSDSFLSIPSPNQLNKTQMAWHEYIGIAWYILKEKLK
jgi:uncharacterized SAM-binding protein YcdF (DUF218 family)